MIVYQFDQCFDDKKVIQACNSEGLVTAHRLPKDYRGMEDPQLLANLLAAANPLLTLDRALPSDHASHIPETHPGIIVVNYSRGVRRTITTSEASKILKKFKQAVPTWHQVLVRNSVLEITEKSVEVWHIEKGNLIQDSFIPTHANEIWVGQLLQTLNRNAETKSQSEHPP